MSFSVHKAEQRGKAEHGWLHANFSFSFSEYYNPFRMGFGDLRVINDDIIEPHSGFGMHPHHDMEIITIIEEGELTHEDSYGHKGSIKRGEIQYMRAGNGIMHSEFNHGNTPVNSFQIWIKPKLLKVQPTYEQRSFSDFNDKNHLVKLISPDGAENSIEINQDAYIYSAHIDANSFINLHETPKGFGLLLFVVNGSIQIGEYELHKRDELQIVDEGQIEVKAVEDTHIIVFEVRVV